MGRRILACLLTGIMLFLGNLTAFAGMIDETAYLEETSVSGNKIEVNGDYEEEISEDILSDNSLNSAILRIGGNDVSVKRIEWLKELTSLFEFYVDEDNYPDNYYSDIDSANSDYYEVMLATEFGLVDVPAGSAFDPEGAATREFVAHTLNLCIGYVPENEGYTFSESQTVTYPEDIQAAIEQGWFSMENGAFLPEQPVTMQEKEAILEAAENIYHAQQNPSADGTYQYKAGVILLPEGMEISTSENNKLIIADCPTAIQPGKIFGIVHEGMPLAWKAVAVEKEGNLTVISIDSVSTEEAFENINVSSDYQADLSKLEPASDNVTLSYIVGGTEENAYEDGRVCSSLDEVGEEEINAVLATEVFEVSPKERARLKIGDAEVKATCKITNQKVKFGHSFHSAFIDCYFKADFTCSVSGDLLEAGVFHLLSHYFQQNWHRESGQPLHWI